MEQKKLIVIGAGGHAKVIVDILQQNGEYDIVGLVDRAGTEGFWGIPVIGEDADLKRFFDGGISYAFVALGANHLRKKLQSQAEKVGFQLVNVISKSAVISSRAKLGHGVAIMPGAVVNADTTVGDGVIINTNASVDHDCVIEDFAHIAPGTNVAGKVKVGEQSFLGVGSRVIDGITVGSKVTAGAGTIIIHNVEANCTIVGSPARRIK